MRGTWTRVCLALLATAWTGTILAATHPADDAIAVVNWAAPPYWIAPATESSPGEKQSLAMAIANPALAFHAVTPCRIVDTRGFGFTGPYGPPGLTAGAPRSFAVTSPGTSCNIPSGVAGVSFNFAATTLTANGNLVVYPMGAPAPAVSSLNWTPSEVAISNSAVIALGSDSITVLVNGPVGSTANVIIDVNGYFAADPVVSSVNGISGAVTLVPSGDVTVTPSAPNVTIGTNAVSTNTPNTLVRRDASGNFAAGTVTGTLNGNANGFSGSLAGDVTGTQGATVVSSVGGSTAANVHSGEVLANAATSANTNGAIVRRSGTGDFTGHTVGASGGFLQPGTGGQALRIVRGIFQGSNGALVSGAGFSVVRNSAGNYSVTFSSAFADSSPSVCVTPLHNQSLFFLTNNQSVVSVDISFVSSTDVPTDPAYVNLIAIGVAP